ncbi:MAG: hypothetical protein PHS86_01990 [Syntrophaceae bacterium]|nr:hypothetical protein [Syntrophaceae bacterium]
MSDIENFSQFLKQMIAYMSHFSDMVHLKNEQTNRKADPESFAVCTTINELMSKMDDLIRALNPEGYVCPWCDPEKFVIYGTCKKCGQEGYPPLLDFGGNVPIGIVTEKGREFLKKLTENQRDASRLSDS